MGKELTKTCRDCAFWTRDPDIGIVRSLIGDCRRPGREARKTGDLSACMSWKENVAMNGKNELGDAPIENHLAKRMNDLAKLIDTFFNGTMQGFSRRIGFILLVFPFRDRKGGRCNYISNGADRSDVVKMLREQIRRFEEQDPSLREGGDGGAR